MGTRERILTIRLLEKLQVYPEYKKIFGIEAKINTATEKKEK